MTELALVEQEYGTLTNEMSALKSRAGQLTSILNEPIADLNHLSSVRPGTVLVHCAVLGYMLLFYPPCLYLCRM